jgi:alcohol dehydrogenase
MQAAQISEYGDPSVIQIVEIDKPDPLEDQVLVEVHTASLNPFDSAVRAGYLQQSIPLHLPFTLGGDIAGTVIEVGAGVEGFVPGDKVFGQAAVVAGNSGAFAEYTATAAKQVGKAPANLSSPEAASLPLVGVSALQALTDHINLQPGQKIFITGGSGGIGRVAVQLAKHIGAYVAASASGEGIATAKKLGADEVIDYQSKDYTNQLGKFQDFDAVFDTVGKKFTQSFSILKPGGVAVTMVTQPNPDTKINKGITIIQQRTHVTTAALGHLRELIESRAIKPSIGRTFPLSQTADAFIALESGAMSGKIVLAIKK